MTQNKVIFWVVRRMKTLLPLAYCAYFFILSLYTVRGLIFYRIAYCVLKNNDSFILLIVSNVINHMKKEPASKQNNRSKRANGSFFCTRLICFHCLTQTYHFLV